MLPFNAVYSVLENNQCLPVSYQGLITDYPNVHRVLEGDYKEFEAYEHLAIMQPEELENIDREFAFFVKDGVRPIFFIRKDRYTRDECSLISEMADIPLEKFEERRINL